MKNEVLRKKIARLVKSGLSQAKTARRLGLSRERVSKICEEVFGKGVVIDRNMISSTGNLFLQLLQGITERRSIRFLLWVAEEAIRRKFKVAFFLNGRRDEYNVLTINGFRVAVYAVTSVRLYKPNKCLPGFPAYHWEVKKKSTEADYFVLLALFEGFVRYVVILPSHNAKRHIYLSLNPKFYKVFKKESMWDYIGRWDFLSRGRGNLQEEGVKTSGRKI